MRTSVLEGFERIGIDIGIDENVRAKIERGIESTDRTPFLIRYRHFRIEGACVVICYRDLVI